MNQTQTLYLSQKSSRARYLLIRFWIFNYHEHERITIQEHFFFANQAKIFILHTIILQIKQKQLSGMHILSFKLQKFGKIAMITVMWKDNLQ